MPRAIDQQGEPEHKRQSTSRSKSAPNRLVMPFRRAIQPSTPSSTRAPVAATGQQPAQALVEVARAQHELSPTTPTARRSKLRAPTSPNWPRRSAGGGMAVEVKDHKGRDQTITRKRRQHTAPTDSCQHARRSSPRRSDRRPPLSSCIPATNRSWPDLRQDHRTTRLGCASGQPLPSCHSVRLGPIPGNADRNRRAILLTPVRRDGGHSINEGHSAPVLPASRVQRCGSPSPPSRLLQTSRPRPGRSWPPSSQCRTDCHRRRRRGSQRPPSFIWGTRRSPTNHGGRRSNTNPTACHQHS